MDKGGVRKKAYTKGLLRVLKGTLGSPMLAENALVHIAREQKTSLAPMQHFSCG